MVRCRVSSKCYLRSTFGFVGQDAASKIAPLRKHSRYGQANTASRTIAYNIFSPQTFLRGELFTYDNFNLRGEFNRGDFLAGFSLLVRTSSRWRV